MTTNRDSLFPSTSIGRAQGASIVRTPSREALAVHPLLGDSSSNAKYVPYTPRQRPTTTGPTVQAVVSPPPSQSSAPSKPPLANLKAAAQNIGLEANSIGWAILEKISYEGDTSDEWTDVWNALTKSRATLLLPTEPSSPNDAITHEFVQDHIVFCDLASKDNTAVVTLSGLRGHLTNGSLTFRSTLHRSTKSFQAILTRSTSLDALPPLPVYPPQSSYPSFAVSSFTAALPLPSRATKPPLPPRPGTTRSSSARLPMHFVSLFGQRPSTPPPPLPPTQAPTTPSPSVEPEPSLDITAFVIDTPLNRSDIATAIINGLKSEIAIALADHPPWLVERVHAFALAYFPFVKLPAGKKKLQDIGGNPNRVVYAVNGALDNPEELAERFQAFYTAVENELRRGARKRGVDGGDASGSQEPGAEQVGEEEERMNEAHIRNVLETIESTLCMLLYDRLFLPSTSDDASHNEALSSRVAALNMLDLGLEHLDIDVSHANHAEVDAIVRTCGQTLAQLDLTARSPREKVAVLVSAHKLVVEGLSKIPPIRLKSREDDGENPMRRPSDPAATPVLLKQDPIDTQSPLMPTVQLCTSPDQLSPISLPSPESAPPSESSPVSGDVLLPILIFSVVKANPSKLVSHLLFTQRFRNQCFGGEESYCLINLMAVAEFLENVDLGALGLGGESEKVLSTADLTPIPIAIARSSETPISAGAGTAVATAAFPADLRGRVGQGIDGFAGSANKVILGVVDTSFGVLRAFLPGQAQVQNQNQSATAAAASGGLARGMSVEQGSTVAGASTTSGSGSGSGESVRPNFGLLRRDTGFSIAGLTAALPGGGGSSSLSSNRGRSQNHPEEVGQRELVEVTAASRPASLRSHRSGYDGEGYGEEEVVDAVDKDEEGSGEGESGEEEGDVVEGDDGTAKDGQEENGEEEDEEDEEVEEEEEVHDTRSIKSFESMLSGGRPRKGRMGGTRSPSSASVTGTAPVSASTRTPRKRLTDLTDRLTHGMAGMSRRVVQGAGDRDAHRATTTTTLSGSIIPLPNRRFVECTEQDIRVSEVGELLREYQRLVEAVRSAGGFQE